MRRFLILLLFIVLLYSCTGKRSNFVVKCTIESNDKQQMYLARRTLSGTVKIDSVLPDHSETYVLKGYTEMPDFFILYFKPGEYINLIIHPGEHISITGNSTTLDYAYYVEGSKDSRLVQKMVAQQAKTLQEITNLSLEYENSLNHPDFEKIKGRIDSAYNRVVDEHRNFSIDLIKENPESLASLMALYQQLGRNTSVFDYKQDFQFYEMVDANLSVLYPNSEAVRDLNRKVAEVRQMLRIDAGSNAPDIVMSDTTGTQIALSSLQGRIVLLCFYASWSSESIRQNATLSEIYDKFADSDVVYYEVSLDRTMDSWMRSLRDEHPKGIQVSDLQYWDSPVVTEYLIDEVPQLFLLDREGRIVDKGFAAEEAEEKIANLLKEPVSLK